MSRERYDLSLDPCNMSQETNHFSHVTFDLSRNHPIQNFKMLHVTFYLSRVTFDMSHVTCYLSRVTYKMSLERQPVII
jgi:hypothetical protein